MAQEPTTRLPETDTGPLPTGVPPGGAIARASRRRRGIGLAAGLLAILGVIALVLVLTRQPDPLADERPVQVVQAFAAALEARDVNALMDTIEPTTLKRELRPQIESYLSYVEEMRFENARYELVSSDGERAQVRWTATMRYRLNFGDEVKSGEGAIDRTVELTKIEGSWYLSGVALPEANP